MDFSQTSSSRNLTTARQAFSSLLWSRSGSIVVVCGAAAASWFLSDSALGLLPVAVIVLYFMYGMSRRANQLSELHLATIEALALAIDAKDQISHNHIRRVQVYATSLARALGM